MSTGSLFAGWAIHKTGKYKMLNVVFGTFTFFAACLLAALREDSGTFARWASIVPAGFGNAVVLQTTLSTYLSIILTVNEVWKCMLTVHLQSRCWRMCRVRRRRSRLALGRSSGALARSRASRRVGQYSRACSTASYARGWAASVMRCVDILCTSHTLALTEVILQLIMTIRHSAKLVAALPPVEQRAARDSYAAALRAVFIFAAAATAMAYVVRVPVRLMASRCIGGNNSRMAIDT
jgi:hypothetical protein